MSSPALSIPFKNDDDLTKEDAGLSTDVYASAEHALDKDNIVNCEPQVISSPKKTGKTTLFNLIYDLQRGVSYGVADVNLVRIDVPRDGFTENELRELLTHRLRSDRSGSLEDIVAGSALVRRGRVVLAVIDAEQLEQDALLWLLYGVKVLDDKRREGCGFEIQVIIDGSFTIETLTCGPNSPYPMSQCFPREFTRGQFSQFVLRRFDQLNLELTDEALEAIWDWTHGDKYLTQTLCLNLVTRDRSVLSPQRDEPVKFSTDDLHEVFDEYIGPLGRRDVLRGSVHQAFARISNALPNHESGLRRFLMDVRNEWDKSNDTIRDLAYRGGLIRRVEMNTVSLRAPLVKRLFEEAEHRVRNVRALLDLRFLPEGVREDFASEAAQVYDEILESAYDGSLHLLHAGSGRKESERAITVDAVALGKGYYEGTWETRSDGRISPGSEVWCLLWSRHDETNTPSSTTYVFPVRTPPIEI